MWIQPKKNIEIIKDNIFHPNYSQFSVVKLNGTFEEAICVSNHNNEYKIDIPQSYYSRTGKFLFSPKSEITYNHNRYINNKNIIKNNLMNIKHNLSKYNTISGKNIFKNMDWFYIFNDFIYCKTQKAKQNLVNALFTYSNFSFSGKLKSIDTSDLYLEKIIIPREYMNPEGPIMSKPKDKLTYILPYNEKETLFLNLLYGENFIHKHTGGIEEEKTYEEVFDKEGNIIEHPTLKDMKITSTQHFVWSFEPEIVEKYLINRKQGERIILDDKDKNKTSKFKVLVLNGLDDETYLLDTDIEISLEMLFQNINEVDSSSLLIQTDESSNIKNKFQISLQGYNFFTFTYYIDLLDKGEYFKEYLQLARISVSNNNTHIVNNFQAGNYNFTLAYFKNNKKNNKIFGFIQKTESDGLEKYPNMKIITDISFNQFLKDIKNGNNFFFVKLNSKGEYYIYGVNKKNELLVYKTHITSGGIHEIILHSNLNKGRFFIDGCIPDLSRYNEWIVFSFGEDKRFNVVKNPYSGYWLKVFFMYNIKTGKFKIIKSDFHDIGLLGKIIFFNLGIKGTNLYVNPFGQIKLFQSFEQLSSNESVTDGQNIYLNETPYLYKNSFLLSNLLNEDEYELYIKNKNRFVFKKDDIQNKKENQFYKGIRSSCDDIYGLSSMFLLSPYSSGNFLESTFNFTWVDILPKENAKANYYFKVEYIVNAKGKKGLAFPVKYSR